MSGQDVLLGAEMGGPRGDEAARPGMSKDSGQLSGRTAAAAAGAAAEAAGPAAAQAAGPTGRSGRAGLDVRAVWQVSSMSLGIGIFAIPYSFLQLGVVPGALWIAVMGAFANVALQRLLDVAADCGITSYEGLAEHAFGQAGKLAMPIITMVTTGIATLSYLSAARSLLVGVAVAFFVDFDVNGVKGGVTVLSKAKDNVLLLVLSLAVLPRCLSRSIGAHAWISTGGVFAMCLSAAFFVYSCIQALTAGCDGGDACGDRPPAVAGSLVSALPNIATLAFSFSMCFALFPVMQERVVDGRVAEAAARMKPAVRASVGLSCCIYLLVGLGGAFAFGAGTQPLALQNLPLSRPLTQVICLVVGVSTTLLVAIVAFPTIQSLELLVGMCRGGGSVPDCVRSCLVVGVGLASILVDAFVPTKVAFALTGSLGLATGAYIMPCLLALKLEDSSGHSSAGCRRVAVLVVLLFGCVLFFGSTPVTVWQLIRGGTGPEPQALSQLLCQHQPMGDDAEAVV